MQVDIFDVAGVLLGCLRIIAVANDVGRWYDVASSIRTPSFLRIDAFVCDSSCMMSIPRTCSVFQIKVMGSMKAAACRHHLRHLLTPAWIVASYIRHMKAHMHMIAWGRMCFVPDCMEVYMYNVNLTTKLDVQYYVFVLRSTLLYSYTCTHMWKIVRNIF